MSFNLSSVIPKIVFTIFFLWQTLAFSQTNDLSQSYYAKATSSYSKKEFRLALEYINMAIAKDSLKADYNFIKGAIYLELESYDSALVSLKKVKERGLVQFSNSSLYECRGLAEYHTKHYEDALVDFKTLLAIKKDSSCYYYIGKCYVNLEDFRSAIPNFQNSLLAQKSIYDSYTNLSYCEYKLGNYDKTEAYARKCLELKPEAYLGNYYLTRALYEMHRYHEMLEPALIAFNKEPKLVYNIFYLGYAYSVRKDTINGLKYLNQAVDLAKGTKVFFREQRGMILTQFEKYDTAIADLEYILEFGPSEKGAEYYLASCYAAIKDTIKAEKYFQIAVERYNTAEDILVTYANFEISCGKYNVAKIYNDRCLALNPLNITALSNQATLDNINNDYEGMIKHLNEILANADQIGHLDSSFAKEMVERVYLERVQACIYFSKIKEASKYLDEYQPTTIEYQMSKKLMGYLIKIKQCKLDWIQKDLAKLGEEKIMSDLQLVNVQLFMLMREKNISQFVDFFCRYLKKYPDSPNIMSNLIFKVPTKTDEVLCDDIMFIKKVNANGIEFQAMIKNSHEVVIDILNYLQAINQSENSTPESIKAEEFMRNASKFPQ